jgi:plastocyanin
MKKIFFILFSGLFLSACYHEAKPAIVNPAQPQGNTKPAAEATTQNQVADIEISGFKFTPATLTVKAGQIVTVVNRDSVGHTVTADDGTSFESGLLGKDQSGTITAPAKPGNYPYHCAPHPNMKGILIVE